MSRIVRGRTGRGLVAARDLAPGAVAARFAGSVVPFRRVGPDEIRHALWLDGDRWLLPRTAARFINHACAPNAAVKGATARNTFDVVVSRALRRGEEITIAYDVIAAADFAAHGTRVFYNFWDRRWTFRCRCGAPRCRRVIKGYVLADVIA